MIVGALIKRFGFAISTRAPCRHLDVRCVLPSAEDRRLIFEKVCEAIRLIEKYSPLRLARIRRDLRGLWITQIESIAQYHHDARLCILDYYHLRKKEVEPAQIAAAIIHEATHARLMLLGFGYEAERRVRIEHICFKAEIAFASRLPDGRAIIEEARSQLERDPQVWSTEAAYARKTSKLRELGFPEWLIRLANRGKRA